MTHKPNCYECKYRGDVPGSAHSRCRHPGIDKVDPLIELASMLGGGMPPMRNTLNVKGEPHGIRNGWFSWPLNFDPTWLLSCDGFESKSATPTPPGGG